MRVFVEVNYGTHKHGDPWESCNDFCMNCGQCKVWWCDAYNHEGSHHICASCGWSWLVSYAQNVSEMDDGKQRIEQLRRASS